VEKIISWDFFSVQENKLQLVMFLLQELQPDVFNRFSQVKEPLLVWYKVNVKTVTCKMRYIG
jgi:hypothetical protein